jgi:hypothetical protein
VRPTLHGKAGAAVDFYATVTGVPHAETVDNPREPGTKLQVVRVEGLVELITCRDCWKSPHVQKALAEARRTGVLRPA